MAVKPNATQSSGEWPYTYTAKKSDWSIVGSKDGDPVSGTKTHYDELEMTIPVQSASN